MFKTYAFSLAVVPCPYEALVFYKEYDTTNIKSGNKKKQRSIKAFDKYQEKTAKKGKWFSSLETSCWQVD